MTATTNAMPSRLKRQIITLAVTFLIVLVMKFFVDDWIDKQNSAPAPTTGSEGATGQGTTVETLP